MRKYLQQMAVIFLWVNQGNGKWLGAVEPEMVFLPRQLWYHEISLFLVLRLLLVIRVWFPRSLVHKSPMILPGIFLPTWFCYSLMLATENWLIHGITYFYVFFFLFNSTLQTDFTVNQMDKWMNIWNSTYLILNSIHQEWIEYNEFPEGLNVFWRISFDLNWPDYEKELLHPYVLLEIWRHQALTYHPQ